MTLHPFHASVLELPEQCAGGGPGAPVQREVEDAVLQDLASLAAQLLECPIATIAVADGDHFDIVVAHGCERVRVPRERSLCRGVSAGTRVLLVPDARMDECFADSPSLCGTAEVRFYLGIGLFDAADELLGVLSIADPEPRFDASLQHLVVQQLVAGVVARVLERRSKQASAEPVLLLPAPTPTAHDPLTDGPSREALLDTVAQLAIEDRSFVIALVGIDGLTPISDTLGPAICESLMKVVAFRLLARMPDNAHLMRFGGDEFALVLPDASAIAVEDELQLILRDIARPCEIDYHRIHLQASMGLADRGSAADANELLAHAGLAMREARRTGGQRLRWFEPAMHAEAISRRSLDLELRRACLEGEFELHYQPQIQLASGLPTGAEALLRWRHPEHGLLYPAAFIEALSHSALAPLLGRWILERACYDAATWPEVSGRRLAISINLFPVQLDDEQLLGEVDRTLALTGLQPGQLELELTETIALRDNGLAAQLIAQLRARGVRVSFDDFGTGFASLSMLHRLPVDRIKIDQSFVRNVMGSRGDEAIVRSITLMAHNFDLQVVAEGVETASQATFLHEIGCSEAQGFLYSHALAPEKFHRWLGQYADRTEASNG